MDEIAPGVVEKGGKPYVAGGEAGVIAILRDLATTCNQDQVAKKYQVPESAIAAALGYAFEIMQDEVEINKTSAWRASGALDLGPGIVADKDIRFGLATVKGRRVDVLTVLGQLANGVTLGALSSEWHLSPEQIGDVLNYAAAVIDSEVVASR